MASSNTSMNETAGQQYMRQFVDYLDNGIDFPELSQIRQLDICLQNCYHRLQKLVENINIKRDDLNKEQSQTTLMNILIQIKMIGDQKMQLSQQMLDTTERQSKKLKIAHQKYLESINQGNIFIENNSNENDSESETDSDIASPRSSSNKSLWKRKGIMNIKRKCLLTSEQNGKKFITRNIQTNTNGRKLRMNNDSSITQSDETTYCLCSQLSYGSMILCDNKLCEIKWFHFNCVNLTSKPKGKWFCPSCRDNRH